ncbi:MAG: type II toxin-antitoxin system VapC family toxin [Novosphingobium sp.]
MIVVDTSVWIDHFRRPDRALAERIAEGDICLHPYVLGELLLGGVPARSDIAKQLDILARPPVASASEAAAFITWAELAGTGIGFVDANLLISAKLLPDGRILTGDKHLHAQATRLGLAFEA